MPNINLIPQTSKQRPTDQFVKIFQFEVTVTNARFQINAIR